MAYKIPESVFSEVTEIVSVEDLCKEMDCTRGAVYNFKYKGISLDNVFFLEKRTGIPVSRLGPTWKKGEPRCKQ